MHWRHDICTARLKVAPIIVPGIANGTSNDVNSVL